MDTSDEAQPVSVEGSGEVTSPSAALRGREMAPFTAVLGDDPLTRALGLAFSLEQGGESVDVMHLIQRSGQTDHSLLNWVRVVINMLRHARQCLILSRGQPRHCQVPECEGFRALLQHIQKGCENYGHRVCPVGVPGCTCFSTTVIVRHMLRCNDSLCPLCGAQPSAGGSAPTTPRVQRVQRASSVADGAMEDQGGDDDDDDERDPVALLRNLKNPKPRRRKRSVSQPMPVRSVADMPVHGMYMPGGAAGSAASSGGSTPPFGSPMMFPVFSPYMFGMVPPTNPLALAQMQQFAALQAAHAAQQPQPMAMPAESELADAAAAAAAAGGAPPGGKSSKSSIRFAPGTRKQGRTSALRQRPGRSYSMPPRFNPDYKAQ